MNDFAKNAVIRFWRNIIQGLNTLLNDGTITLETSVKDLLEIAAKKLLENKE